jgi:hypothetical protein
MNFLRSLAAGAAATVLGVSVPAAQPADPYVVGSPTAGIRINASPPAEYQLHRSPEIVFVELSNVDQSALAQLPKQSAGPFARTSSPFEYIDTYFDRRPRPDAQDRSPLESHSEARLLIAGRRPDGVTRWWRAEAVPPAPGRGIDFPAPLDISDKPSQREQVMRATPDPALPIIDVQYAMTYRGANSGGEFVHHLLLDFRDGAPSPVALLDEQHHEGGGACTTFDSIFSRKIEIGCRWDPSRNDFICAETVHGSISTAWFGAARGSSTCATTRGCQMRRPPFHGPLLNWLSPAWGFRRGGSHSIDTATPLKSAYLASASVPDTF